MASRKTTLIEKISDFLQSRDKQSNFGKCQRCKWIARRFLKILNKAYRFRRQESLLVNVKGRKSCKIGTLYRSVGRRSWTIQARFCLREPKESCPPIDHNKTTKGRLWDRDCWNYQERERRDVSGGKTIKKCNETAGARDWRRRNFVRPTGWSICGKVLYRNSERRFNWDNRSSIKHRASFACKRNLKGRQIHSSRLSAIQRENETSTYRGYSRSEAAKWSFADQSENLREHNQSLTQLKLFNKWFNVK